MKPWRVFRCAHCGEEQMQRKGSEVWHRCPAKKREMVVFQQVEDDAS